MAEKVREIAVNGTGLGGITPTTLTGKQTGTIFMEELDAERLLGAFIG